jgi:hypothetical protein
MPASDPGEFAKMIVIAMLGLAVFVALGAWYFANAFSGL